MGLLDRLFRQCLAISLCIALVATSTHLAEAAPVARLASSPLQPPAQLGYMTDHFNAPSLGGRPTGRRTVVLIQDLHAHYGVQKNIAGLLDFIETKMPFALAVEGAWGPVDNSILAKYPDPKVRLQAADYLLREAEITGADLYAIRRGLPWGVMGVEREAYYKINRDLYRNTFEERRALAATLADIQIDLSALPRNVYSPELKALSKQEFTFKTHELYLEAQLAAARRAGTRKGVVVEDLVRLQQDLDLLQRLVDLKATEVEVHRFAPRLPEFLAMLRSLLGKGSGGGSGLRIAGAIDAGRMRALISASIDYYVMAIVRNKPMVENTLALLSATRPADSRDGAPRTAVLITGGFHTRPITQILREKKISYVVLTPAVDSLEDSSLRLYERRLRGEYLSEEDIRASAENAHSYAHFTQNQKPSILRKLSARFKFRSSPQGKLALERDQVFNPKATTVLLRASTKDESQSNQIRLLAMGSVSDRTRDILPTPWRLGLERHLSSLPERASIEAITWRNVERHFPAQEIVHQRLTPVVNWNRLDFRSPLLSLSNTIRESLADIARFSIALITQRFPSDTTFGFEFELKISRQLGLADGERLPDAEWETKRQFVIDQIESITKAAGWSIQGADEKERSFIEIKPRHYYQNTPEDWAAFKKTMTELQAILPGGFYGVHMHVGRGTLTDKDGKTLKVDRARFGRLAKVYEALWRAMAGRGWSKPGGNIRPIHPSAIYDPSDVDSHDVITNLSDHLPTIEFKFMSGLMNSKDFLDVDRLDQQVSWTFSWLDAVAEAAERFPLALLGIPLIAGEKPSRRRIAHFLELVFGQDAIGAAQARQVFDALENEPAGLSDELLYGPRKELQDVFKKIGLERVFLLHQRHDGLDENIVKHLLEPETLKALAEDLFRAGHSTSQALGFFPLSMHRALEEELEQVRASHSDWKKIPFNPATFPDWAADLATPASRVAIESSSIPRQRYIPPPGAWRAPEIRIPDWFSEISFMSETITIPWWKMLLYRIQARFQLVQRMKLVASLATFLWIGQVVRFILSQFPRRVNAEYVNAIIQARLPEDLLQDEGLLNYPLHTYTTPDGKKAQARIIPIQGLFSRTGQLAHIGLGQMYGEPVVYVDARFQKNKIVLDHEVHEIARWEAFRTGELAQELGKTLTPAQMRDWIKNNVSRARELERQWHQEAPSIDALLDQSAQHTHLQFSPLAYIDDGDVNLAAGSSAVVRSFSALMNRLLEFLSHQRSLPLRIADRARARLLFREAKSVALSKVKNSPQQHARLKRAGLRVSLTGSTGSVWGSEHSPVIEINLDLSSRMTDGQLAWVFSHELGHAWQADNRLSPRDLLLMTEFAGPLNAASEERFSDSYGLLIARMVNPSLSQVDFDSLPSLWTVFLKEQALKHPYKESEIERMAKEFRMRNPRFNFNSDFDPHLPTPKRIEILKDELLLSIPKLAKQYEIELTAPAEFDQTKPVSGGMMVRDWRWLPFSGLVETLGRIWGLGELLKALPEGIASDPMWLLVGIVGTFVLLHAHQLFKDKNGERSTVMTGLPFWVVLLVDTVAAYLALTTGLWVFAVIGAVIHTAVNIEVFQQAGGTMSHWFALWKRTHSTQAGIEIINRMRGAAPTPEDSLQTHDDLNSAAGNQGIPVPSEVASVRKAFTDPRWTAVLSAA